MTRILAAAVTVLGSLLVAAAARGEISWTGDVLPHDPPSWWLGTVSYIGKTGTGEVVVTGDSVLQSRQCHVGLESGSQGTLTVAWPASFETSEHVEIGYHAGSQGTVTIGGTWTSGHSIYVGRSGSGTLNIDGGTVNCGGAALGISDGSTGEVTVIGTGATWTITHRLDVGLSGSGTLNITGATVSNGAGATIGGYGATSSGEVNVGSGSTWTTGLIDVAYNSSGTLNITGGGTVNCDSLTYIGREVGSTGEVMVDGIESTWTIDKALYVGNEGSGTLNITNGGTLTVTTDGEVVVGNGTVASHGVEVGQLLRGRGTVQAPTVSVLSGGTVSPGPFAATLSIVGNYVQSGTGAMQMEIGGLTAGGEHDSLDVAGNADLAGTLDVRLLNDFEPLAGHTFQLITTTGGVSGTFDTKMLPALDGLVWGVDYGQFDVTLNVYFGADFDEDGNVDGDDFLAWQTGFGTTSGATHLDGDADGDGDVDGDDFLDWQARFGSTSGSSSTAVPEPGAITLVLVAAIAVFAGRRR